MKVREIIISAIKNYIESEKYEYLCDNCKKVFDYNHIVEMNKIIEMDKRYLCVKCVEEIYPEIFKIQINGE